MKLQLARTALATAVTLALASPAHAVLERMGPINNSPTVGGFPAWFQDTTGIAIEFCDPTTASELEGGWCVLLPGDAVIPEHFPDNFFDEHFYYRADAAVTDGTTKSRLVLAVEAAFNNAPAPGDGITFGRIRVFVTNLPFDGTYTIHHPYGTWVFPDQVAGDRIFFTQDIGVACTATFECTLQTELGPYVLPSETPGGHEVPPIPDLLPGQDAFNDILIATGTVTPYPNNGKKYIADPARLGPVTGSPLPPFVGSDGVTYNHNIFRVEGPNGFSQTTTDFSMGGRLLSGPLPGKVNIDRASYATATASATGLKLDVFATGNPTEQARLPNQPRPAAITPQLNYFEAACSGTPDPINGDILPPFGAPAGVAANVMVSSGTKYWGQSHPASVPSFVCVKDSTSVNQLGQTVPTYYLKKVTDEVTPAGGSGASFNPADGGTLSVASKSSDTANPPVLTVAGFGDMTNGLLTVSPLTAPPSTVSVHSSEGGVSEQLVQTEVGFAGGVGVPVAVNDEFQVNEDCSATVATSCATPLIITPLANDTIDGQPLPIAGSTIAITTAPRLGTAVLNANGTISYTPNSNVNGADSIGYTVTRNARTSNAGVITVNITPVNDLPTAVNDSADAVLNVANSMNLIANDTDIDGNDDVKNAQIVTWPAGLGPQPVPVNGVISFTPNTAGTLTFTYRAVDSEGALSTNSATGTVRVIGNEQITFVTTLFRTGALRWRVDGNDSILAGQQLTLVYANGTLNAANGGGSCTGIATASNPNCVISTATVDALGAWAIDRIVPSTSPLSPISSAWTVRPTQMTIFSSSPVLGGSRTTAITLKN
jgi:Big-like domain-containing protein